MDFCHYGAVISVTDTDLCPVFGGCGQLNKVEHVKSEFGRDSDVDSKDERSRIQI